MKKIMLSWLLAISGISNAAETITIVNSQGPTSSLTPQVIAVINEANKIQNKYQFVMEYKTGAFESLALRTLAESPQTRLSTISNSSYEAFTRKLANEDTFVPVTSQGDVCWAVYGLVDDYKGNGLDSLNSLNEIVNGGPGFGGAAHIAALELGRMYNKPVRFIPFKSSFDAFTNMVQGGGINFVFERVSNYEKFKSKNPNIHILAVNCPTRHHAAPGVKTLKEYNITTPFVWQQIVAHKTMDPVRVAEFNDILTSATKNIGAKKIFELSDQIPAVFQGISHTQHYQQSLTALRAYRHRYSKDIEAAR